MKVCHNECSKCSKCSKCSECSECSECNKCSECSKCSKCSSKNEEYLAEGYLRVRLCLSSDEHAKALARRLIQLSDRIRILVASREEGTADTADQGGNKDFEVVITDETAAACSSASALLDQLKRQYTEHTGRRLCCAADKGPKLIGVSSAAGGSGTSAAAVTLARLLAGKLSGTVLFIFAGGLPGARIYLEEPQGTESRRNPRELDFVLRNQVDTDIGRYLVKDRYGMLAAETAADPRLLLKRLEDIMPVEAAVIDCGSGSRPPDCDLNIRLAAGGDLRAAGFTEWAARSYEPGGSGAEPLNRDIFVLNKAERFEQKEWFFTVPPDEESFRPVYGGAGDLMRDPDPGILPGPGWQSDGDFRIEIAMDGMFAASMRKVAEAVYDRISERGSTRWT